MIQIKKPTLDDLIPLSDLAKVTLVQSHGHSSPAEDISAYLEHNYSLVALKQELEDPKNIYHLIYYKETLVGFSKIVFNQPISAIENSNITKLERIYLLDDYHGLNLAQELLQFNIELAKANDQVGMWLYTWIENKRAIAFYEKMGFVIVGEYDFKVSPTHSNPNWQYYLGIE